MYKRQTQDSAKDRFVGVRQIEDCLTQCECCNLRFDYVLSNHGHICCLWCIGSYPEVWRFFGFTDKEANDLRVGNNIPDNLVVNQMRLEASRKAIAEDAVNRQVHNDAAPAVKSWKSLSIPGISVDEQNQKILHTTVSSDPPSEVTIAGGFTGHKIGRISRDQAEEILSALQSVAIDEYSQLKWRTTTPKDAGAASAVTSAAGSYHEPLPPGVHLEGREEEKFVFATPPGFGDELNYLIHSNGVPYAELLKTWPQIYEEAGYRLRNPQYGLPDLTSPQEEIRTRVADREPIPANEEFTTFNRRYFCAVTDWKRAILRCYGHKASQEIYLSLIHI